MYRILLALKGMAMGMAEVVPGVSGGTIAFITGIYERLIFAIKSVDMELLKMIFSGRFAAAWKKLDGSFLLTLFLGMAIGVGVGVFVITWFLENKPLGIWSFFFGLILASCFIIGRDIDRWNWQVILSLVLGAALVYYVTVAVPLTGRTELWYVFLCGVVAISALLLPGLSGSFILLLLGMYTAIIPRVKEILTGDLSGLPIILAFAGGCIVGVLSFARVLSWAFRNFKNTTLAFLTGLMIGSLNKVWPWQEVLNTRINSKGEEVVAFSRSVLPGTFDDLEKNFFYGTDPQLGQSLLFMAVGLVLVLSLSFAGRKLQAQVA